MPTMVKAKKSRPAVNHIPWASLPSGARVLYVTTRQRTGAWLAEAFSSDPDCPVTLEEVIGTAAGLTRLRDDTYDAVLVSHLPGELDALELIRGYRGGGADEPIVVLGSQSEQEMGVLSFEAGADSYVCINTATTRNLIWVVVRAIQRHHLLRENRRLNQAEETRLQRERQEAERILQQQAELLTDQRSAVDLPDELRHHYRELLRTYVIMGSGNLSCEIQRLGELFAAAGLTAAQVMQLHVGTLEELVHGLGTRSSRHVMSRADLLGLELLMQLAEEYRQRHERYLHPPLQQLLPGF